MAKTKIIETEVNTPAVKPPKDWGKVYQDLEDYIILNQKKLIIIGSIILGIAALVLAYLFLYLAPRQVTAKNQIYKAQEYFAADSLDKALKGDGNNAGFETIASEYSQTESANLAYYYMGSIYLKKGQFQKAIDALNHYSAKDILTSSLSQGMIGDAYSELNNLDKALEYYRKAESINPNNFTTPIYLFKEGLVLESQNQNAQALAVYQRIKKEYSESTQARDIDKYIARVQQKI
jgi:tetratricopeptide (TPR) repeat protein